ncbi:MULTISPECIES: hypothetical protein [unclassified Moorena]|uniref:hypothetical protein n=1 Tax=unclassified Moorena TaxID=2683338 RepID=UPI0013FF2FA7|nr:MULTISPECIES: hypothetical protein [unclassified Moorena]NEO12032.1 hypothetical protein [Moorena sp. SIO3E8]NEQ01746.1 hypothetical protein [Moorena sp. SIO3F7]
MHCPPYICPLPTLHQLPDSRFPIPDSRFPIPDSRFPIPDSRFPIPDSRFPRNNFRLLLGKSDKRRIGLLLWRGW